MHAAIFLSLFEIFQKNKILWKVHFVFALSENFDPRSLMSSELHSFGETKGLATLRNSDKGALVGVALDSVDEETTISEMLTRLFNCEPGHDATVSYALRRLRPRLDTLLCLLLKIPSPADKPEFTEVS